MKISAATLTGTTFEMDVSEELELENFKAFCEMECGIPSAQIVITLNGRNLIDDKLSLKDHGVKDGDLVLLQQASARQATSNRPAATMNRKYTYLHCSFVINAV